MLRKLLRTLIIERFRVIWLTLILCLAGLEIYIRTPIELLPKSNPQQYLVAVLNPGEPGGNDTKKIERIVRESASQIASIENVYSEISPQLLVTRISAPQIPTNFTDALRASIAQKFSENEIRKFFQVTALGRESASTIDLMITQKDGTNTSSTEVIPATEIVVKLIPALEQIRGISAVRSQGLPSEDIALRPLPGMLLNASESEIEIAKKISETFRPPSLWEPTPYGTILSERYLPASRIESIPISINSKATQSTTIGNLYAVEKHIDPHAAVVLSNSSTAFLLAIHTTAKADLVQTSLQVKSYLERFNKDSQKYTATIVSDAADYINAAQENVGDNLKWGVILTCLCILIFAQNIRYTAITAISIPVSLALTFPFFEIFSISRNVMSLAGITLSVGVVVDATIAVVDGIDSGMRKGLTATEAAWQSACENFMAVAMTSLSTLAVFVPILFLKGTVGDLFFDLSLTVIISQTIAFLVAVFIVPGLTSAIYEIMNVHFETESDDQTVTENIWSRAFASAVKVLLTRKLFYWSAGIASIALAVIGVAISPPTEFLPKRASHEFRAISPEASESDNSLVMAQRVDETLRKMGAEKRLVLVDSSGLRADFSIPQGKSAELRLMEEFINRGTQPYRTMVSARNPIDVEATNSRDLEFYIPEHLQNRASFKSEVEAIAGVSSARWSSENTALYSRLDTDSFRMLTLPSAPGTAWALWSFSYSKLLLGADIPSHEWERTRQPRLIWREPRDGDTRTHPALNSTIPESREDILTSTLRHAKTSVIVNGETTEGVALKIQGKTVTEVSADLEKIANRHKVQLTWGISKKDADRSIRDLGICFVIATIAIIALLYIQNRSFSVTTVIMCTFIWGLIGSFPGLVIHGESLNASAIVGFILLAGTIVNNGILLMSLVGRSRRAQLAPGLCCLDAVSHRTIPVFITSLTTAVGMLPMVWDTGEGSQMYRALSIVVVYGTMVSTPISLIGIPSIFMILYDIQEAFERIRLRILILFSKNSQETQETIP